MTYPVSCVQDAFFDNQKRYMEDVKHLYDDPKNKVEIMHGAIMIKGMFLYHIFCTEEIKPSRYYEIQEAIENITNGELIKKELENHISKGQLIGLKKDIDMAMEREKSLIELMKEVKKELMTCYKILRWGTQNETSIMAKINSAIKDNSVRGEID